MKENRLDFWAETQFPRDEELVVYFLVSEANSAVKIGLSSSFRRRFKSLDNQNPTELVLWNYGVVSPVGNFPDDQVRRFGMYVESLYHKFFAESRIKGEWFDFLPVQSRFIEATEFAQNEINTRPFVLDCEFEIRGHQ